MARATEKGGILRACPTCQTPVDETLDLGLRNFQWVDEALPGRIGLMDVDAALTQYSTGRALFLEFKPRGMYISTGARLTFALLVQAGFDVWAIWDLGGQKVKLSKLNDEGRPYYTRTHLRTTAAKMVAAWWEEGLHGEL